MISSFVTLSILAICIMGVCSALKDAGRYEAEMKRAQEERAELERLAKQAQKTKNEIDGMTDEELRKFLLDD